MAGDLHAEAGVGRERSAWPGEEETRPKTPLSEWLPSVLPGRSNEAQPEDPADSEPAAAEPAPAPRKQKSTTRAPEPEPDPEPQLTRKELEAVGRWWNEVGDPAVAAFSRCLQEHVVDEVTSGSQSSYPDFVTSAMNTRCTGEFAAMARVILDRHGEDDFARIARKLIATKFVPAVKQVVEGGPSAIPPEDDKPALMADMRRSKEAMLGCLEDETDRMAVASAAAPERVADRVIAACQAAAEAFFGKLGQLYPGAAGGDAGEQPAAILDASYRPAIIQRISTVRASLEGDAEESGGSGKADAEIVIHKLPQSATTQSISPAGERAPGSPARASSRP
jgi:hypothetical protein